MSRHTTVLLTEAVEGLHLSPQATVIDATFGAGGHSRAILTKIKDGGTLIGIDADATALADAHLEKTDATVHLVHNNFSHIREIARSLEINSVDGILADLGWRMEQFAGNGKGFSFMHDEPLIMTYGDPADYNFTAADIINDWDEHVLADIIFGYAEERFARRIAKKIVEVRAKTPIETTFQLVEVVKSALPGAAKRGKTNPATKTFQALRIAVNDELSVLETFITDAFTLLAPGGRLAIITFHSIEDRIVKLRFKELASAELGQLVTKKPIVPSAEELNTNPRARSAKLRIIEKFHTT